MVSALMASATVAAARAGPTVRITRPIGPVRCAKGCSTWARTADLAALALAVRLGTGRAGGLHLLMRLTLPIRARTRSFSAGR